MQTQAAQPGKGLGKDLVGMAGRLDLHADVVQGVDALAEPADGRQVLAGLFIQPGRGQRRGDLRGEVAQQVGG